ncbi:MAG: outer membrane beta-barrel protein [Bacteroidetes bacterium]|nr:outer membrane beta-barrel protein [Bacteroidota bacterium]
MKNYHNLKNNQSIISKTLITLGIFLFGIIITSHAQIDWGIKGGLNYNSNGNLISESKNIVVNPDSNVGYHFGVFLTTKGKIYIRPELVFTHTKSKYEANGLKSDFKMDKIDAPILVGLKIIGPLNIFIGPSFQYIINTDLEDINLAVVEKDFTVGGIVGVGVQVGKLGVDLKYERGFSSNEAEFIGIDSGRIDTRPKQLIASVSYKF